MPVIENASAGADEVAKIVAGLTKAQRAAVLSISGDFAPFKGAATRQAVAALAWRHADLCEREWQDGCAQVTYYRLTPLGLAVRVHLQEHSHDS